MISAHLPNLAILADGMWFEARAATWRLTGLEWSRCHGNEGCGKGKLSHSTILQADLLSLFLSLGDPKAATRAYLFLPH